MEDNTYQLNAVIFDAMEFFVKVFADGDSEKDCPGFYHEKPSHVEELSLATEAIPCTVLAAFEENSYKGKIEICIKGS